MALHPCTACGRHVRHHEKHCPFCNAALGEMDAELSPVMRVSRAAMWLGAALTVGACDKHSESSTLPVSSTPMNATQNGAMPNTQVLPTTVNIAQPVGQQQLFPQPQLVEQENPQQQVLGQPTQPTQPAPNVLPAYGGPPPVRPRDTIGSMATRYGRPPVPPQGPNDSGSHARRYGAPALVEWDEV
jgi:hypothetical protein